MFYNSVSAKDRVQDISINQLKLKVNDSYKKMKKNNKLWKFWWPRCYEQSLSRYKNIQNKRSDNKIEKDYN